MRRLFLTGFLLVAVLYLMPVFFSNDTYKTPDQDNSESEYGSENEQQAQSDAAGSENTKTASENPFTDKDYKTVTVSVNGKTKELDIEKYVEGVVSAEAPGEFPIEALKAQAVAARTYAVYKISRGRPDEHPDADLCDNYSHCAAYREPDAISNSNIRKAVKETKGEVLFYDNAPIAAMFHCASSMRTEAALDVFGEDVPYLKSVVSPGGSKCGKYEGTVTISADDFRNKINEAFPSADVSGPPEKWFSASTRSAGGAVKTVNLGGETVDGTAIRELFNLNSTNFMITTKEDSISFHTIGYGHCVGLSQYGAKYMAEQDNNYQEILSHYYPGTAFENIND